jgi:aerobic carbon-monoxide dehydrogenase medium subunit
MFLPDLMLHEPRSLEDAADLLRQLGPQTRVMAGGTDLLVDLKAGRHDCPEQAQVVSIRRIPGLRGIEETPAGLRIGALTTINDLIGTPLLRGPHAALRDAACEMAAQQVRSLATIGGNVAGGVPCADLPPVLLALSASLELWSAGKVRQMPLEEFHFGPRRTALREGELLTHILVPNPGVRAGAAYQRFALRAGNAIAVAGVAAALALDTQGKIVSARIALNAVAPVPMLVAGVGAMLAHRSVDEAMDDAAAAAMAAAKPISDVRGSADFRRELVGVLTRRALTAAHARAMENLP